MKKLFGILALACCLLSSCSKDDESPFEGKDNHILSFSLTVGGTTYDAAISGKKIVITVPVNVDLTGATVTYELCEQATVSPDPATIETWNDDQQFRIKAYNGATADYTYSVSRTEVSNPGDVALLTQADVEALGQSGTTVIDGNLIVGTGAPADEETAIKDLSPLRSLTRVNYNIVINNSFAGATLDGLDGLTKAGGLYIGTANTACNPQDTLRIELPGLTQIGDIVINSPLVVSFAAPQLTSGGSILFNAPSLASVDFGALKSCAGDIAFKGSSSAPNQRLTEALFPALVSLSGSFSVEYHYELAKLSFSGLTAVGGDFRVGSGALGRIDMNVLAQLELPRLVTVNGSVTIAAKQMPSLSMPALTRTGGFSFIGGDYYSESPFTTLELPALATVAGTLKLGQLKKMESLSLPALKSCTNIEIDALTLVTSLDFSQIADLEDLSITSAYELTDLKLASTIHGDVSLNGAQRNYLVRFSGVETIEGALTLSNFKGSEISLDGIKRVGSFTPGSCSELTTLSLPDLEIADSLFKIFSFNKLTTVNAPALTRAGDLSFESNYELQNLEFPVLQEVTRTFNYEGASWEYGRSQVKITGFPGLSALKKVGKITISGCGHLTDFTGLKNTLTSLTADDWSVMDCAYNPTYEQMKNGEYKK